MARRASIPFFIVHFIPLALLFTGVSRTAVVLFVFTFALRTFFVTAGYHRYFAHRAYRMGRVPQFIFAAGGLTTAQKDPLWWASIHRAHHRHSDTDLDPHSPHKGFWWSHVGWILSSAHKKADLSNVEDLARYPELRFMNRHDWIGPWALGVMCFLVGGWSGLLFGFFLSTILLWHATFSVNSVTHLVGRRRYATDDTSRNLWPVALLTFGEGWHNNHHHCPNSARQGFRWWELDISFALLRVLSWLHVVRDLRQPSPALLAARRIRTGNLDVGMVRLHLARAADVVARLEQAGHATEVAVQGAAKHFAGSIAELADAAGSVTAKQHVPVPAPTSPS
jgi:stearoyl-CoA desaturase (Delta-9 desaturase)